MLGQTLTLPLREKCPYSEFLWSVFSPYSAQMWENKNQKNSEYGRSSRSWNFFSKNTARKLTEQMRIQNPVKHLTSGFQPATIFVINSILDIWQGSEYVSAEKSYR